jgi:hypothetical protein
MLKKGLFPPRFRPASPLLFLLAIGGAIALVEYWMQRQLRQTKTLRPSTAAMDESSREHPRVK